MEQLSQSPFFPVPVRWFEIPMQTARWGLGQLAQSTQAGTPAAAAIGTDASAAPESELTFADSPTGTDTRAVGVILNEFA